MSVIGPGVVVVLAGDHVHRALLLISAGIRHNQLRNGIAPHPEAVAIQRALAAALATASPDGQMDDQTDCESSQSEDDTIDAATAAKVLGLSRRSVYRLIRDGVLPARKHCGTWVLARDLLDDYRTERSTPWQTPNP